MSNIQASLLHSIRFINLLLEKKRYELLSEPLVQLVRDIYQWRFASYPFHSVDILARELDLPLEPDEIETLRNLELSMRKPDKYREAANTLPETLIKKLLKLCENNLKLKR